VCAINPSHESRHWDTTFGDSTENCWSLAGAGKAHKRPRASIEARVCGRQHRGKQHRVHYVHSSSKSGSGKDDRDRAGRHVRVVCSREKCGVIAVDAKAYDEDGHHVEKTHANERRADCEGYCSVRRLRFARGQGDELNTACGTSRS
jgi:hypothetical protein